MSQLIGFGSRFAVGQLDSDELFDGEDLAGYSGGDGLVGDGACGFVEAEGFDGLRCSFWQTDGRPLEGDLVPAYVLQ